MTPEILQLLGSRRQRAHAWTLHDKGVCVVGAVVKRILLILAFTASAFADERRVVVNERLYWLRLEPVPCASGRRPCGTPASLLPRRVRVQVHEYNGGFARIDQKLVGRFEMPCWRGACADSDLERNVRRVVAKGAYGR